MINWRELKDLINKLSEDKLNDPVVLFKENGDTQALAPLEISVDEIGAQETRLVLVFVEQLQLDEYLEGIMNK
mgnify:CR=1 FL=1